eukprot:scaffold851_cov174-Pinguiococcus_pyrenoidosus.AAC.1
MNLVILLFVFSVPINVLRGLWNDLAPLRKGETATVGGSSSRRLDNGEGDASSSPSPARAADSSGSTTRDEASDLSVYDETKAEEEEAAMIGESKLVGSTEAKAGSREDVRLEHKSLPTRTPADQEQEDLLLAPPLASEAVKTDGDDALDSMSVDLDALRSEQDAVDDAQRTSPPQAAQQSQSVDPNVLGRQEGNLSKRRP